METGLLRPINCSMQQIGLRYSSTPSALPHAPTQSLARLQRTYPAARPDALATQCAYSAQRQGPAHRFTSLVCMNVLSLCKWVDPEITRHWRTTVLQRLCIAVNAVPRPFLYMFEEVYGGTLLHSALFAALWPAYMLYRLSGGGFASVPLAAPPQQLRQSPDRIRCAAAATEVSLGATLPLLLPQCHSPACCMQVCRRASSTSCN